MRKKILITLIVLGNYTSSYSQEAIGINTALPRTTLDVNGKLTVRDTENLSADGKLKALYVDTENGVIGTVAPTKATAPISVFEASTNRLPSTEEIVNTFNKAENSIKIPIDISDVAPNNLNLTVENKSDIVISEDGTYQISSYINLAIATNTVVRKLKVQGASNDQYINLTNYYNMIFVYVSLTSNNRVIAGTRPVLTSVLNGQANLIILPTITSSLKKGDKLSLQFMRTTTSENKGAGSDVTSIGLTTLFGARPYNINITKL